MRNASGIYTLIICIMLINSCKKDETNPPEIITTDVTGISYSTATSGGNVLNDGGDSILARGICWSTSSAPTVDDNKTSESGSLGTFISELSDLVPDTKYFIRAYASNAHGTGYGNEITFSTIKASTPDITTSEILSIAQKSALCGGSITCDNGSSVVARGLCWSLDENPTTSDSKSSSGSGSGDFSSLITGLEVNTSYHVRAYATNREGTAYGNDLVFTTIGYGQLSDIENNIYNTIIIGSQEWMTENLKTTRYSNGDPIPNRPSDDDWSQLYDGAYCWYDNNETANRETYGALYNWFAGTDSRNVCPQGWHVPGDADWTVLTEYLINNGYGYGGSGEDIAKSMASKYGWTSNTTEGTIGNDPASNNSSGFSALPGGVRIRSGNFAVSEYTSSMWSGSERSYNYGNALTLTGEFLNISRAYTFKQDGASIRCLKNN
jgi:uncharacterized protein (TIGR02145 family)